MHIMVRMYNPHAPKHSDCIHYRNGFCDLYKVKVNINSPVCPNFIPKTRGTGQLSTTQGPPRLLPYIQHLHRPLWNPIVWPALWGFQPWILPPLMTPLSAIPLVLPHPPMYPLATTWILPLYPSPPWIILFHS